MFFITSIESPQGNRCYTYMDEQNLDEFIAPHPNFRSGIVSVVGRTNVGKSTLVNSLIGEKVSIVCDAIQTTRHMIRGIYTGDEGQLTFLDTPGLYANQQHSMGSAMNKTAKQSMSGTDVLLIVLDPTTKPWKEDESWLRRAAFFEGPVIVALNKQDCNPECTPKYKKLWEQICLEKERDPEGITWLEISATEETGVDALRDLLISLVPLGPLLFPAETLSDFPKKLLMGDIIREKLIPRLKDEVPHSMAVWIEDLIELPDRMKIQGRIYVERNGQKGIVIGKNGCVIKPATREAEKELTEIYGKKVSITLLVKVEPKWRENYWILQQLGVVEPKK